jgi:hypothetical protein
MSAVAPVAEQRVHTPPPPTTRTVRPTRLRAGGTDSGPSTMKVKTPPARPRLRRRQRRRPVVDAATRTDQGCPTSAGPSSGSLPFHVFHDPVSPTQPGARARLSPSFQPGLKLNVRRRLGDVHGASGRRGPPNRQAVWMLAVEPRRGRLAGPTNERVSALRSDGTVRPNWGIRTGVVYGLRIRWPMAGQHGNNS